MNRSLIEPDVNREHERMVDLSGQRAVRLLPNVVEQMERNPLLMGLMPTDIGLLSSTDTLNFERSKGIRSAAFIYFLKGNGWCEIQEQRCDLGAGDLLIVPPNEAFRCGVNDNKPWIILWFQVVGSEVRLLLEELGDLSDTRVIYLGDEPQIPALFEDTLEILEQGCGPIQLVHASRVLGNLISLMISRSHENWREQPDVRQKINYCITYMKRHMDKSLRLNTVATVANLSPSYFNTIFRRETGCTCMDYLTRLRIHQACEWLDTTDWPVKTIAARLAYEDPLYFSKAFSSFTGLPPKEYRRTRSFRHSPNDAGLPVGISSSRRPVAEQFSHGPVTSFGRSFRF